MIDRARIGHGGSSRDYAIDVIVCYRENCPANARKTCVMPSAIIINAAGQCATGDDLIAKSKKKPKRPLDGD